MSDVLVSVLAIGPLAPAASVTVPHNIVARNQPQAPRVIWPDQNTTIGVTAVTSTNVTFKNFGGSPASANFYVLFEHSYQRSQQATGNVFWQGGTGGGGTPSGDPNTQAYFGPLGTLTDDLFA